MSKDADFASAAMMRLVVAGLTAQGIRVPGPAPAGAHVERTSKSDVLDHVITRFGPKAILSIADAVPSLPPEPIVIALRNAHSVPDLLDRWGRLEVFSHACHRVDVTHVSPTQVELHHISLRADAPTTLAESLLVLGLLTRLCEFAGAQNVTLVDHAGHVWRCAGAWFTQKPGATLGPLVLSFDEDAFGQTSAPPPETDPDSLRQIMADDPVRRWSVASLADQAGMSERSLQRFLTNRSTSFSRLLSEARLQAAATRLCSPFNISLAEIGFLSGYADQAHFSRDFKRAVGTTPKAYQAAFRTEA